MSVGAVAVGGKWKNMKKVRAFDVDPAPLSNSCGISKARGGALPPRL
jgi:hypothetical protein